MSKQPAPRIKVRDHRFDMPVGGIERKRRGVPIMLDPNTGGFFIAWPEKVVAALVLNRKEASGQSVTEAVRDFDRQITEYYHFLRAEGRERVIVVRYAYNKPYDVGHGGHRGMGGDSWNNSTPEHAFGLEYEILWRIGDRIFDVPIDEDTGRIYGDPTFKYNLTSKGIKILDWTEDREAFFEKMIEGLDGLISRMNGFFGAEMLANVDLAIAAGGSMLALPSSERAA